ncbi:hypothetical protein DY969_25870 [Pseudomonas aeruginosa]|uniref:hypothetical protein n=1 Tax=Pseudomonas aeruginosa TaxID=287 RepID=UPI000F82AB5F|nr:hypothetical protein [Pseudomonas aeruginosa]RTU13280.1 hypothetical protein DY969_25870 [Pseudomonas aeruginosa]RTV53050.1 hypothetical protein DY989_21400 [Pseudomonas aeruginosa]HCF5748609.1 hypothetical protein [Pseudomonas aeruginosa]
MSQVNLTTVAVYKGDAEHMPLDTELPLSGIDRYFPPLTFPSKGITCLYGHRNPALVYLHQYAALAKQDSAAVDVTVEIETWLRQKVDFSDAADSGLKVTRFLSVARAKKEITDYIDKHWLELTKKYGLPAEDFPRTPTRYPHLLDEIITLEPFKHLAVIAYTVETPQVGQFQVATIFDLDAITLCDGGAFLQNVDLTY